MLHKQAALFQTVHAVGELEAEGGFLGAGQEGDPLLVIRVGTQRAHGLEIQIAQGEQHVPGLLADVLDADLPRLCPEKGNVDEVQHALGRLAVAIDDLVQQIVGVLLRADGGHAAVQVHPFLAPGDASSSSLRYIS